MSHGWHDIFAMVISFINNLWEPTHIIMGIFEVHNTIGVAITNQVKVLLNFFSLLDKVIAYVKDERSNIRTLTLALINVVTCSPFQLTSPFVGSLFCL
jgi:hypothetical protein